MTSARHRPLDRGEPVAIVGGRRLTGLLEVSSDLSVLDTAGIWAVVLPFDAEPLCARFAEALPAGGAPHQDVAWHGPDPASWSTSLARDAFTGAVERIRDLIADGAVYQVNLTRRLSAPLPHPDRTDSAGLAQLLAAGNPAPFAAWVRLPDHGIDIVSASPERFLSRRGARLRSSPIKGTAATADGFLPKDRAENVMIVDLVRNDLGRICEWGSVHVPSLLATEAHPGLFHLVSTVEGTLRDDITWPEILDATFRPGSVTGAPKIAAIRTIQALEPVERGPYCGSIGWVDADRREAELNVAIRTFWIEGDHLHFGTGGGITYDSDPLGEWRETELKAARLIALASQTVSTPRHDEEAP